MYKKKQKKHFKSQQSTTFRLLLPHVFFTLAVGGFQPFDPGVALLRGAGVTVGIQLL